MLHTSFSHLYNPQSPSHVTWHLYAPYQAPPQTGALHHKSMFWFDRPLGRRHSLHWSQSLDFLGLGHDLQAWAAITNPSNKIKWKCVIYDEKCRKLIRSTTAIIHTYLELRNLSSYLSDHFRNEEKIEYRTSFIFIIQYKINPLF